MSERGRDPDTERDDGMDAEPEAESDDGDENGVEEPVEVGDNREKYVTITEHSGERTEHEKVYLRHTTDEFVISPDDSFQATETTRYPKTDLLRVEIAQHHSTCFITTAAVGEGQTLDSLRAFREDVFRPTAAGSVLLGVYERLSPPIAHTLRAHPAARTTRLVRWLVTRSGALARRREATSSESYRSALALALTLVYVFGVFCALSGHVSIRLREPFAGTTSTEPSA